MNFLGNLEDAWKRKLKKESKLKSISSVDLNSKKSFIISDCTEVSDKIDWYI